MQKTKKQKLAAPIHANKSSLSPVAGSHNHNDQLSIRRCLHNYLEQIHISVEVLGTKPPQKMKSVDRSKSAETISE